MNSRLYLTVDLEIFNQFKSHTYITFCVPGFTIPSIYVTTHVMDEIPSPLSLSSNPLIHYYRATRYFHLSQFDFYYSRSTFVFCQAKFRIDLQPTLSRQIYEYLVRGKKIAFCPSHSQEMEADMYIFILVKVYVGHLL